MLGNLLAGVGLVVALLIGGVLITVGASGDAPRDGGRALGTAMFSLVFLAGLALAYTVATFRGGFDWLGWSRGATLALVLVAVAAAVLVNAASAALRLEPASQVPWAILPVRGWLFALWPPMLLAGAVWALWPGWFGGWPPLAGRLLSGVPAAVSLLVCLLMLVQGVISMQQDAVRRLDEQVADDAKRDGWVREQVIAADPEKDLVSLMNQTSKFEKPDIRELALAKVRSHPQLNDALAGMLRNGWREKAFVFLESNEPPDAAALAEPVREGMLGMAEDIRQEMRATHTLHQDQFERDVERMIAVADQFAVHGVDYRPALLAVRRALDEPRDQPSGTPDLSARHVLDRWLARAPTTKETRPSGR